MSVLENDALSAREENAFSLSRAAILLDKARENLPDQKTLAYALNHNLELWIAIRSFIQNDKNGVVGNVRDNLVRLSQYVSEITFKSAEGISEQELASLININLQISEGLLEGLKK